MNDPLDRPAAFSDSSPAGVGGEGHPVRAALHLLVSLGEDARKSDPARAADCFRQAADLARSLGDQAEEGRVLLLRGTVEKQRGRLADAESCLVPAADLLRACDGAGGNDLAACLNALGHLRLKQGRSEEAGSFLAESLARTSGTAPGSGMVAVRAETLELLGVAASLRGESLEALRTYEEALAYRQAAGDAAAVARILNQIGNLRHRMGEYQDAVGWYRRALEQHRARGDVQAAAATANNLASTLLRLGEMQEARALFEECRTRFEETGDRARAADVLSNLGLVAQAEGKLDEAARFHLDSLARRREIGDPGGESCSLTNLSYLALARGACEEALLSVEESLALLRRTGLEATLAPALVAKGLALLELGRVDEAEQAAEAALAAAERTRARDQTAEALALRARVCEERGRSEEALEAAVESRRLADETGDPEMLASAERILGAIRLSRGELEEAKQALARAGRLLRGWDDSYERARILFDEGVLLSRVGAREAAAERLRRAEMVFARIGNPRWRIRALLQLALLLDRADPAQAEALRTGARDAARRVGLTAFEESVRLRLGAACEPVPFAPGALPDAERLFALITSLGATVAAGVDAAEVHRAVDAWMRADLHATRCDLFASQTSAPEVPGSACARVPVDLGSGSGAELRVERAEPFVAGEIAHLRCAAGIIGLALRIHRERAAREAAPSAPEAAEGRFEQLIGASAPMREVYRVLAQAAPTDSTVLVLGESGTGKELAARAVHTRSRRAAAPFIAISCPSIPKDLIESELFGHERGAFTGATESRPGKIELAHGGTLFLDEVADIPPATQSKLLRFLQEREFERVGGRRSLRVDVRLVAATSRDLAAAMERGEFREDLFYRLNVVPILMPALRARREDIPLLVEHFLCQLRPQGPVPKLSTATLDGLLEDPWPGNVRELRNAIEYMLATCAGDLLEPLHLPAAVRQRAARFGAGPSAARDTAARTLRPGETLEAQLIQAEADLIRRALEQESWNQSAAARRLGITESKIRNRMKRYGIRKGP